MPFARRHRHRQTLCRWLVGVLLATQWLVVLHACPAGMPQGAHAVAEATALPDCHKALLADAHAQAAHTGQATGPTAGEAVAASGDGAALCKAHCTAGQQLPADAPAADALPPLCGWCIVQAPLPLLDASAVAMARAPALGGAPPPGWPPLYIAHGVLRN
jgi:hypothetical protein